MSEVKDSYVWRYMSLSKFKKEISEGKIYFANPKQFDDPNEVLIQFDNGKSEDLSLLTNTYGISCWHLNDYENILMWKTYIPSKDVGIALKIKLSKLKQVFSPSQVNIKEVKYVNVKTHKSINHNPDNNLLVIDDFIFVKTKEYKGENEIRVTAIKDEFSSQSKITSKNKLLFLDEEGFYVPFDIKLVDAIILHPQISEKECKYIEEIKEKTGAEFLIEKSVVKEKLNKPLLSELC
ncbi:MAG: hypothetical protein U5N85_11755 [Arcicella sp.]|nr:hypothetical protein [Arcicella sp.]